MNKHDSMQYQIRDPKGFTNIKEWAKQKGAKKLYISAHSAVESQAFYKSMGCVEAEVYNKKHVEDEPYDCQLECDLQESGAGILGHSMAELLT